jgi:hypothetical protein
VNATPIRFRRSLPLGILFGLSGTLITACGDSSAGSDRDCLLVGARVAALSDSAAQVRAIADELRVRVGRACANIAGELPPDNFTDQDTRRLCDAAIRDIRANLRGEVRIIVIPPVCTIDAQAQFDCEAECQAAAQLSCQPPQVELRCEPGELSVECSGTCNVEATCEGSLEVAVNCEGTCSGVCEGSCSGNCSAKTATGQCAGACEGTCTGECRGSCEISADDGIECGANARCRGGCTGTARAPRCEGELSEPTCTGDVDVNCTADCEGSATLNADCQSDAEIIIEGALDADFAGRLRDNLPELITVARQAALGLDAVRRVSADTVSVGADVARCILNGVVEGAGQFAASAQASAQASVSVSVSFSASVDVAGSVSSDD